MTREDAIKELKESLDTLREYDIAHSSRLKQSLEMAIRTLENHDIFMKRAYSQGKQDALSQEPCDDAISRSDMLDAIGHGTTYTSEELQRIIQNLPPVNPKPCDDVVSRKDAEQMFRNIRSHLKPQDYKSAEEFNIRDLMLLNAEQMIHALPSVTQKSGKWIEHPEIETSMPEDLMFYECSECGDKQCYVKADTYRRRFCGVCGAKMESDAE